MQYFRVFSTSKNLDINFAHSLFIDETIIALDDFTGSETKIE